MCEDGATVAATPTFPHSGQLRSSGRRAVNRDKSKPSGNTHKIPEKT